MLLYNINAELTILKFKIYKYMYNLLTLILIVIFIIVILTNNIIYEKIINRKSSIILSLLLIIVFSFNDIHVGLLFLSLFLIIFLLLQEKDINYNELIKSFSFDNLLKRINLYNDEELLEEEEHCEYMENEINNEEINLEDMMENDNELDNELDNILSN